MRKLIRMKNNDRIASVCVYCGSSNTVAPAFLQAADELVNHGLKLVYGGGGVGLMGATAKACHAAGGKVLGIMPRFLRSREHLFDDVETRVVENMHERKMMMFEESDAFLVMPGGIGTLEEVIELLSWRRLDLHTKPIVFVNLDGFWDLLLETLEALIPTGFAPANFTEAYCVVTSVEACFTAMKTMRLTAQPIDTRKVV